MHKISKETDQSFSLLCVNIRAAQSFFSFSFHDLIVLHRTNSVPCLVESVGGMSEWSLFT